MNIRPLGLFVAIAKKLGITVAFSDRERHEWRIQSDVLKPYSLIHLTNQKFGLKDLRVAALLSSSIFNPHIRSWSAGNGGENTYSGIKYLPCSSPYSPSGVNSFTFFI